MTDFEEQTIAALKNLFDQVRALRQINIRDILKPEIYHLYEERLQQAYDALTTVEDALNSLGMKLEYEHYRLGGAVDELIPLMISSRSTSDIIMEAIEKRLSENL
jgi:hypothetical protein